MTRNPGKDGGGRRAQSERARQAQVIPPHFAAIGSRKVTKNGRAGEKPGSYLPRKPDQKMMNSIGGGAGAVSVKWII